MTRPSDTRHAGTGPPSPSPQGPPDPESHSTPGPEDAGPAGRAARATPGHATARRRPVGGREDPSVRLQIHTDTGEMPLKRHSNR